MPIDLVRLWQDIGLPWSVLDAVVTAALGVFLVCLLAVVIDVCYLSVAAQREKQ